MGKAQEFHMGQRVMLDDSFAENGREASRGHVVGNAVYADDRGILRVLVVVRLDRGYWHEGVYVSTMTSSPDNLTEEETR